MTEEEIKQRIREIEHLVIFSITRLAYLLQINNLVRQKNRIILRHPTFYTMIQRDFSSSAILSARKLVEPNDNTHNINSLVAAIKLTNKYREANTRLDPILKGLTNLTNAQIANDSTILASTSHAHISLRRPRREITVQYQDLINWLDEVGKLVNQVSGIFWRSSVLMQMPESEGDSFAREFSHMELAELAGTHLLRVDEEHQAVEYAKNLMQRRQNS